MSYTVTHVCAQPGKAVSINEVFGRSWQKQQANKKAWLEAGWAHGNEIKAALRRDKVITPLQRPATIRFSFSVVGERRRDAHNYAGTICKWFIDGLVLAKVFKDDSSEHLTLLDPTFQIVKHHAPKMMSITIEMEDEDEH